MVCCYSRRRRRPADDDDDDDAVHTRSIIKFYHCIERPSTTTATSCRLVQAWLTFHMRTAKNAERTIRIRVNIKNTRNDNFLDKLCGTWWNERARKKPNERFPGFR